MKVTVNVVVYDGSIDRYVYTLKGVYLTYTDGRDLIGRCTLFGREAFKSFSRYQLDSEAWDLMKNFQAQLSVKFGCTIVNYAYGFYYTYIGKQILFARRTNGIRILRTHKKNGIIKGDVESFIARAEKLWKAEKSWKEH